MISLTIPGQPVGKGRPKFTKNGCCYTPPKTKEYERYIQMLFLSSRQLTKQGAIKVFIIAYYAIPKSTSKKLKEKMLSHEVMPTVKPDIDNVVKIVLDALNGYAYEDDKQIASISAVKMYSDNPRVEIQIEKIMEFKHE